MKRPLYFILLLLVLTVIPAYAHPGSLDDKGGHTDSATGEYHFHHGYPAHQHTNGQCPYNFDDQTNRDYNKPSQSYSTGIPKTSKPAYTLWDHITNVLTAAGVSAMLGLLILIMF